MAIRDSLGKFYPRAGIPAYPDEYLGELPSGSYVLTPDILLSLILAPETPPAVFAPLLTIAGRVREYLLSNGMLRVAGHAHGAPMPCKNCAKFAGAAGLMQLLTYAQSLLVYEHGQRYGFACKELIMTLQQVQLDTPIEIGQVPVLLARGANSIVPYSFSLEIL